MEDHPAWPCPRMPPLDPEPSVDCGGPRGSWEGGSTPRLSPSGSSSLCAEPISTPPRSRLALCSPSPSAHGCPRNLEDSGAVQKARVNLSLGAWARCTRQPAWPTWAVVTSLNLGGLW
ncbi:Dynein Heavy Chain 14, Axonemal [Manis pentadactyla]|nr:Dynein Heavy Chain 14, Axonemal [Manis pentadactyla]